ncbi:MAG: hypothetical protein ACKOSS_07360 [Planctomycetia bacterium]
MARGAQHTPAGQPDPGFEPQPLAPRDLQQRVTPGMRLLGEADRADQLAREAARVQRQRWDSPRRRRRLASFVVGALVFLPLLDLLLVPSGARSLLVQLPAAALVGLVLGLRRWDRLASGLWVAAYVPLLLALQGVLARVLSFAGLLWTLIYFFAGFAVGTSDELTRDEDA